MKKIAFLAAAVLCCTLTVAAQNIESGHEYVDLGLPSGTLWATMNVGATEPEEYGWFFAWGETGPKGTYSVENYKLAEVDEEGALITKYNDTDGKTTLDPEDDAATVNWGGRWRMPTSAEWTELRENCTWTWTTRNNVCGYEVKGTNGSSNSIFIPATGYRLDGMRFEEGSVGYYWSSSISTDIDEFPYNAWFWYFGPATYRQSYIYRNNGLTVRPVCQVTTPTALAAAEMPTVYATDGLIVCAQEFRIFDLLGRDVTRQNGTLCGVYVVKTADAAQKVVVK